MQRNYFFISIVLIIVLSAVYSCKKNSTPTLDLNQSVDTSQSKLISNTGLFISSNNESVKGKTLLYATKDSFKLAFQDFSSTNGPDLKVYLSKDSLASAIFNVGSLKSTMGSQVYSVSMTGLTIKDYPFIIIFCKQYNIPFGYAKVTYLK